MNVIGNISGVSYPHAVFNVWLDKIRLVDLLESLLGSLVEVI